MLLQSHLLCCPSFATHQLATHNGNTLCPHLYIRTYTNIYITRTCTCSLYCTCVGENQLVTWQPTVVLMCVYVCMCYVCMYGCACRVVVVVTDGRDAAAYDLDLPHSLAPRKRGKYNTTQSEYDTFNNFNNTNNAVGDMGEGGEEGGAAVGAVGGVVVKRKKRVGAGGTSLFRKK